MSDAKTAASFDVLINGAGLAGLVFALLLAESKPTFSIGIIEPRPPQPVSDDIGLRVVALAPSSRAVLEACGIWAGLPAHRLGVFQRMTVWHGDGLPDAGRSISFDAAEAGVSELGYIVENDLLRDRLWQRAAATPAIELLPGAVPVALSAEPGFLAVDLEGGAQHSARLLVGADGARSWVRTQQGINNNVKSFEQKGIVVHIASERSHQLTAWQRFLPGGPVALLPLADGRSSVVWSCADADADALLALSDSEFGRELTAATGEILGTLSVSSSRAAFPLVSAHAPQYTGERFALIGDAAHQIHPLAGQGVNLGLLDAAALAETLTARLPVPGIDPGDAVLLRRYERWRKGDNQITLGMMNVLHRIFGSDQPMLSETAAFGMEVVNRLPPVKRLLAGYALGRGRDVPRAAQVS